MFFTRIKNYFAARKEDKEEFSQKIKELLAAVAKAEAEYKELFATPGEYIDVNRTIEWRQKHAGTYDAATSYLKDGMNQKRKISKKTAQHFAIMGVMYDRVDKHRKGRNKKVTAEQEAKLKENMPTIEQYQLDTIVSRDKIVLLTGAPSTGKSTALRIKYDAISEGENKKFITASDAKAFAKLAADVVKFYKNEDIMPETFVDRQQWFYEYLQKATEEKTGRRKIIDYYISYHKIGKDKSQFDCEKAYEKYIRFNPPVSLQGEEMDSYAHVEIADFLYMVGVEYRYKEYFEVAIMEPGTKKRYNPEFILPEQKICIEVSQDEEEQDPEFIKNVQKMYAEAGYTQILCCEKHLANGTLQINLQRELIRNGVSLTARSDEELWTAIRKRCPEIVKILTQSLIDAFDSVLSEDISSEEVVALNRTKSKTANKNYKRNERLLSLVLPAVEEYRRQVKIDEYAIAREAGRCLAGEVAPLEYKYIFIDDFQYMNSQNIKLLQAIMQNSDCTLVVAGSDWTACNGQNAANTSYLQEFSRYFPNGISYSADKVFNLPEPLCEKVSEYIKQDKNRTNYRAIVSKLTPKAQLSDCFNIIDLKKAQDFTLPEDAKVLVTGLFKKDEEAAKIFTEKGYIYKNIYEVDEKYDYVLWMTTRYVDEPFANPVLYDNNVAELVIVSGEMYPGVKDRNMLCKAAMSAKKALILVVDGENVSNEIEEFIQFFTKKN